MNNVEQKLWSTDFVIVIIACSGISFCNFFFSATLPIYVKNLTGTNIYAGLIMTTYTFAALSIRPLTGILSDKIGRAKMLVIGAFLCATACFLYNYSYLIIFLILFRILHGIGFGMHSTSGGTVVADIVPRSRLSEGLGYFSLYATIASAAGPGIAIAIIGDGNNRNFKALFILATAFALVSMILDCLIKYERKNKAAIHKEKELQTIAEDNGELLPKTILGFEYGVFLPSMVLIFIFIAFSSVTSFLTLFALNNDFGNIGLFFTINSVGLFISRLFLGKMSDKKGENIIAIPSLIAIVVSFGLIPFSQSAVFLYVLAIPLGVAQGAICPVINTMIFKRCSVKRRGTAAAAYFSSIDIGLGLGALIHANIADTLNYNYVYWGAMLFAVIALIVYISILIPSNRKLMKS